MTGTVSTHSLIAVAIRLHYDEAPLDDYDRALLVDLLIDALPDGHPDVELARSGVWSGTLAEWLDVGPGIVRRVPLVRVELTDRKPDIFRSGGANWFVNRKIKRVLECDELDDLPLEWFPDFDEDYHFRAEYDTDELALADASQRAIAWARRTEVTP